MGKISYFISFPNPNSKAQFAFWEGKNGRWYWHRKVNGRVTDSGDYASRRSCRRALHQRVAREGNNK
jgi:hypothetical protein